MVGGAKQTLMERANSEHLKISYRWGCQKCSLLWQLNRITTKPAFLHQLAYKKIASSSIVKQNNTDNFQLLLNFLPILCQDILKT